MNDNLTKIGRLARDHDAPEDVYSDPHKATQWCIANVDPQHDCDMRIIDEARADMNEDMRLDDRELAAVLAGLRLLQRVPHPAGIRDIFTNCGEFEPMTQNEIDDLCERLNV